MLLENERKKVIEIALKIKAEKLIPLTFGNFSLRRSGNRLYLYHSRALRYDTTASVRYCSRGCG